MNTVVNRPKRRGISLSTDPARDMSRSQGEASVTSMLEQENSHGVETDRVRPQTINFNYMNPISSSTRLSQVIRYEQPTNRRNYSLQKHQWIPQPTPLVRNICIVQHSDRQLSQSQKSQPAYQAPSREIPPTINIVQPQPAKIEPSENELLLKKRLEEKERLINELQTANKIQQARIEFLQKELKSAEAKVLDSKNKVDKIKEEYERQREDDEKQKDKLKSLVMQTQRANLQTLKNKQNKGERRRLDVGKMNEIQAKLNRLISDIKK